MLDPGTRVDIGDHSVQVVANPRNLGDRYLLQIEADPGGPGIRGDFPHLHPSLIETFKCVSGEMVAKVGRKVSHVPEGSRVEVGRGQTHGFVNTGDEQLIVESEVIFPTGYDPTLDLMHFAAIYDGLRRGSTNARAGEPPLLQMAVVTHEWRAVIRQPGIAGLLMPALAAIGRMAGYRSPPFATDEDSG